MNSSVKIGVGLLLLVAIGGIAGILLAPDEGKETRRKIAKKSKKLWKKTKEKAEDLAEKTTDIKDKIVEKGEKILAH